MVAAGRTPCHLVLACIRRARTRTSPTMVSGGPSFPATRDGRLTKSADDLVTDSLVQSCHNHRLLMFFIYFCTVDLGQRV